MAEMRIEERWASAIVEAALGCRAVQWDDGSRDGLHDLTLHLDEGRVEALEVVAAADAESIEFWNLANGKSGRRIVGGLQGGWLVVAPPYAHFRRMEKELPGLLLTLEKRGITVAGRRGDPLSGLDDVLADLGIVTMRQSDTDFPGSVYITMERPAALTSGWEAQTGDALVDWADDYLSAELLGDVRQKLLRSDCDERHVFVILPAFTTAPFDVSNLLMRADGPLPQRALNLPTEVTQAWFVGPWKGGRGMRWSRREGWRHFEVVDVP